MTPNDPVTAAAVRAALAALPDPSGGGDIVARGRVKGVSCTDGRVGFVIELKPGENAQDFAGLRAEAEAAVRKLPGVTRVAAVLTAHAEAPGSRRPPQAAAAHNHHGHAHDHAHGHAPGRPAPARPAPAAPAGNTRLELPGVAAVVAVASGKGGVGKSTMAANLACAIARRGKRVGLLDADVYGPSAPILFGLEDAHPKLDPERRVVPPEAYGVKVMSVGFIASADQAMVWRGPMVTGAINELLSRVNWAPLDVLVIDMPPGTGDVQITLSQRAPISGAVIVSTPQKLALADVKRGIEMFAKVHVPILGVVENMSATTNPETGAVYAPFGMDGAKIAAEALGAPFLGAFPLDPGLAYASDQGQPPAAVDPDSDAGVRFLALADAVLAALAAGTLRAAPEIVFE
jgi:ATP-binding protein involved in chromosome partitioning